MWKVSIPNKAKVHVWRVCLDILSSLVKLEWRRVQLDSVMCVLCEDHMESTLHLCRDCPFTQEVLKSNAVLRQERNDRVWNQKQQGPGDVVIGAMTRLHEFRFHNMKESGSTSRSIRLVRWKAPPVGILKINVDGAFNHVTRQGGVGFVIRNELGIMLAGGACPLSGLLSAEHGEVLACQKALEFASAHSFLPAILETDALAVQGQLSAAIGTNNSVLGRIYDDLVIMLASQPSVSVAHVGRLGNTVAHCLAAHACGLQQDCFYFSTPSFLLAAVAAELCIV
ncbi:uncharacterized protein LOC133716674 [Rosa rugosa]|uniref:uncharacterized protein LOC133716674 n=1 Tax=Rosa rugosa TaxID=74645 RepID=UPI002B409BB8|nr:uncharacterized protein LOC133716674 [Rosa rugosa]